MIFEQFNGIPVKDLFVMPHEFHPFPRYEERAAWEAVSQETKQKFIMEAEATIDYVWPITPMHVYRAYEQTGDFYQHWLSFVGKRNALGVFLFAECLEGEGRFLDQIINGIYALCECTTWSAPNPLFTANGGGGIPDEDVLIVDLNTSETAMMLAWTYYLMKSKLDTVSPRIERRIFREIERRVVKPYTKIKNYWWMGFTKSRINNWNPWCNLNVLCCHLIFDFGETEREKAFTRLAQSLDRYLETHSPDGGCDEGPMYWGSSGGAFSSALLMLREASRGKIDIFDNKKVKLMGTYYQKVFIHGDYFVNYADGDPIVPVFPCVYHYGKNIGDEKLMRLGAETKSWPIRRDYWFFVLDHLLEIFSEKERAKLKGNPPYIRDAWLDEIQVMVAREQEGTHKGLFLSAKAGTNIESHNHNDVGNFIVYLNGKPLFIDIGTEEYRAKTFSPQRFELWYLQSQYHNCPTVNGYLQHDGKAYHAENVAYVCGEDSYISMDIAKAYEKGTGIKHWNRKVAMLRGESPCVQIKDEFKLKKPSPVAYNFMTHKKPVLQGSQIKIDLDGDVGVLEFDGTALDAAIEEVLLTDVRTGRNWGGTIYRIVLNEKHDVLSGKRKFRIYEI